MSSEPQPSTLEKYMSSLAKIGAGGVLTLSGVLAAIYFLQEKLIYMPVVPGQTRQSAGNPPGYRHPKERNLDSDEVEIQASDGVKLRGWLLKQSVERGLFQSSPTVIFFHENAGNLGTRLDYLSNYVRLAGVNILAVAYRGYSESDGNAPNEVGLQRDAEAILAYVFEQRDDLRKDLIFTHGRSLGGATSLYAVVHRNASDQTQNRQYRVRGCILENTFTSIDAMSRQIMPKFLTFFNKILLRNRWNSLERIQELTQPTLFVRSLRDQIVPDQQMQQLIDSARSCAFQEQHVVINGDHNSNWSVDPQAYFGAIKQFIEKCQTLQQIQKL